MVYEWKNLLTEFEGYFLNDEEIIRDFFHGGDKPLNIINPAATNEQVRELERKLSITLPPSYKEFLQTTNGFKVVNQLFGNLFPTDSVQRLISFDPDFVDIWTANSFEVTDEMYFNYDPETQRSEWLRSEYLNDCIAISDWFDGGILLLNPIIKHGEEFEAWAFANWYPGAVRYKSFWDLVKAEFSTYLNLKNNPK